MIVDANILIYAVDENSEHHTVAKNWLTNALNGPTRVGIPWVSLIAFQRITTHPRIYANPLSPATASDIMDAWTQLLNVWIPAPGKHHGRLLRMLTSESGARGNLVTDAHLAALALEHGTSVVSFDADFSKFADIHWENPLDSPNNA